MRADFKAAVEARLNELLQPREPLLLYKAMGYSVAAGGKRLRPVLNMMGCELAGGDMQATLDNACALEMIHTYSLIHDDLPAMDNDELRRGQLTNHMVFGEAQAILAGDGLLSLAFCVMLDNIKRYPDLAAKLLDAASIIADGAGTQGMVAGQVRDVELEGTSPDFTELKYIHKHKTGALIKAALLSGFVMGDVSAEERQSIALFGEKLGLVFQIVDDMLDVIGGEQLGKSIGKDAEAGKVTYVTLFGLEGARKYAEEAQQEALFALTPFGKAAEPLRELAGALIRRTY